MRFLIALAVVVGLALPALAVASTVSTDGSTVTIVGGPESSDITAGTGLLSTGIRDAAGITAGPGCSQLDAVTASCGDLFGGRRIDADLGAGNDKIGVLVGSLGTVHGGPGNDEINGDSGDNSIYGDDGDDVLFGSNGNDVIDGGPGLDQLYGDGFYYDYGGNDTLNSRDGQRDEVSCGLGIDSVTADALDNIYIECDQVDRGAPPPAITPPAITPPSVKKLPTMTVSTAKRYAKRLLADSYRAWRKGSHRVLAKPRRVSRITIKFRQVSVRYRGHTYRGWAQAKYYWKGTDVFVNARALLR